MQHQFITSFFSKLRIRITLWLTITITVVSIAFTSLDAQVAVNKGVSFRNQSFRNHLENQLYEILNLFEYAKEYASTQQNIGLFTRLAKATKEIYESFKSAQDESQALSLYQKMIATLHLHRHRHEGLSTGFSALSETLEPATTPTDLASASEKLEHTLQEFNLTHTESIVKKTNIKNSLRRIFLKTLSQLCFYLTYAHLNTEKTTTSASNNQDSQCQENFSLDVPKLTLNLGKIGVNAVIDEMHPSTGATALYQWCELLIPLIGSYSLARAIASDPARLPDKTWSDFGLNILTLLMLVRFYVKPTSSYYKYASLTWYATHFVDLKKIISNTPCLEPRKIQDIALRFACELPGLLEKIKWPAHLHPKPRRRAVIQSLVTLAKTIYSSVSSEKKKES